ncbi:SDR family NAD(P)-dependent oxidoreductase [Agrilutibacter solisilvae]|uniref:SDR family oxidoreductase n=1 Tax=Agrilutibacter solisilvae TaxID=2763317 RepID=A0A974Y3P9_9GAMM|nr:SDR family oxidoreductase [Lysobacter solisilvae]QSX77251.1 SDR family oxidoreductase [Lysobacter solisilvae]
MIGIIRSPLLVLGATGTVGQGVVEAAVAAGRPVVAVARKAGELARLGERHAGADLTTLAGSVATDEDAERLATAVRALGRPIGGVIAAVSSCANRGGLLQQSSQALRCRLDTDLFPHLAAARAFLPLLAQANRGGSYVVVGGPGSDRPWAGYGHRSIAAAALRMLVSALHDEARPLGVRVQLLSVEAPVRTDCRDACPHWPAASEIGRQALALVDGAGARGRPRAVVPFVATTFVATTAPVANAAAGVPVPDLAQTPGGNPALLTERWLEDTRTLLASIAGGDEQAGAAAVPDAPPSCHAHSNALTSDPHKEASP